ncbi:MAG: Gfo/Idh/MocA family oxidoreductase [Phycisphaerae bacterium]
MLKIGLIGTGTIAYSHALAINKLEGLTLAAVSDIDEAKGKHFATEVKCGAFFTDYRDMLKNADLDVVGVCLPHYLHAPVGLAVLESGRHLLMEKPMANTVAECDALMAKAQAKGLKILVGHTHQYNASLRIARTLLDNGEIGRLTMIIDTIYAYYNWEKRAPWLLDPVKGGGGPLMNTGPHQIDHLLYLTQSKPVRVDACVQQNREGMAVESDLSAHIQFENGVTATLILCQGYTPKTAEISVRLIGTKGMMEIGPWGNVQLAQGNQTREIVCEQVDGLEMEWKEFIAAIKENRNPITDGDYGKRVVALIEAIYRSGREKKPIELK